MSDNTKLVAEKRTDFGKGAARKIRRAGNIPAVMYGHGTEPVHISLPGHDTMMALKQANALLTIVVDGNEQLALAKDVQRDPIKPVIDHVDLVVVRKGEKVTVDVSVHLEGEAAPETVVTLDHNTLQLEALATNIPENVVVSVEGLEAGTQILAGAVELPEGATLVTDAEALVVNVTQAITAEALEAELAEAEAEAGIEREESDEEAAEGETAEAREGEPGRGQRGLSLRPPPHHGSRPSQALGGARDRIRPQRPPSHPSRTVMDTWLVVGLGNPGPEYAGNRHNVGAMAVEELAGRDVRGRPRLVQGAQGPRRVAEVRLRVGGPKVVLAVPSTYMNVSGGPVAGLSRYYDVPADRLVVIHDELDIDAGVVRLKKGGGEGGHNGLRSVSQSIGTKDYLRVRLGIGRPPGRQDPADFVLKDFSKAERTDVLPFLLDDGADAVEALIEVGLLDAQQRFHAPR